MKRRGLHTRLMAQALCERGGKAKFANNTQAISLVFIAQVRQKIVSSPVAHTANNRFVIGV